jgi:DhnA family fructose-bisphosphate aldolase class Ia
MKTVEETLRVAHGAAGVVFGRNMWQSGDTQSVIRALKGIIQDGHPVADALAESEVA